MSLAPRMTGPAMLDVRGLSRSFGPVQVLNDISFSIAPGEVVALLGVNGAGKSTLIRMICGLLSCSSGEMLLAGAPFRPASARDAMAAGVRLVPQEVNVIGELSVAENILLDRLPKRGRGGWSSIDTRRLHSDARGLLDRVGLDVDPAIRAGQLTLQQKRLVEVARALAGDARLLVLDEPTASMTAPEVEGLFATLGRLREAGTSIIYISHHISEVFRLCDRVLVLKDGRLVADRRISEADPRQVLSVMLGRPVANLYPAVQAHDRSRPARPVLEVADVVLPGQPGRVSFDLQAGEVLGVFGLLGSGQEALGPALFGSAPRRFGAVRVDGAPLAPSIRGRIAQGIGYLPAERKRDGIVPGMSVLDNIGLPVLKRFGTTLCLDAQRHASDATAKANRVQIRARSLAQAVGTLSGGNQQKACIARWLDPSIRILVLEEPTRGVDMGARAEIYAVIHALARSGVSILMISSDAEEIAGCCDRMLVLRDGAVARSFEHGIEAVDMMAVAGGTTLPDRAREIRE